MKKIILLTLLCSGAASLWAEHKKEVKKIEKRTYQMDQGKAEVRTGAKTETKKDEKKTELTWLKKINAYLLSVDPSQVGDSCSSSGDCLPGQCCSKGEGSPTGYCMITCNPTSATK